MSKSTKRINLHLSINISLKSDENDIRKLLKYATLAFDKI